MKHCFLCEGPAAFTMLAFGKDVKGNDKEAHKYCVDKLPDIKKAELFISATASILGVCAERFDLTSLEGLRKAYKCLLTKAKKAMKALAKNICDELREIFNDVAGFLGLPVPDSA